MLEYSVFFIFLEAFDFVTKIKSGVMGNNEIGYLLKKEKELREALANLEKKGNLSEIDRLKNEKIKRELADILRRMDYAY